MPRSSTVSDLIKATFQWASENREHPAKFTETALQKILFRLKMSLPPTNMVRGELAYYWYKAGAYSEFVSHAIDVLVESGELSTEEYSKYSLLAPSRRLLDTKIRKDADDLDEAIKLLRTVVDGINPFSLEDEIDSQYIFLSPSLFYPRFKRDFLPTLKAHHESITSTQYKITDFSATPQLQRMEILKKLLTASASLPPSSLLSEFKRIYFDYETSMHRILGWQVSERDSEYMELIRLSIKEAEGVWELFAKVARILSHDPAYDGKVSKWKDDYHKVSIVANARIQQFYDQVLGETGEKRFSEISASKPEFVKELIEQRQSSDILWIRPERRREADAQLLASLGNNITTIPEFQSFISEGELYSTVIERLTDGQIASVIEETILPGRTYVAFRKDGKLTQITYKIR